MRSILIWIALVSGISASAQSIECQLLDSAIHHPLFDSQFRVCRRDTIHDLFNKVKLKLNCDYFKLCNSIIKVNNDTLYNTLSVNKSNRVNYPGLIVLLSYKKERQFYTMFFWKPGSNGTLELKYRVRRGKIKLVDKSWGDF